MHVYVDSKLLIVFPSPLQVPGHLDEGRCRLQLKTVSTYFIYIRYSIKCLMHPLTINVNIEMCCMCMWTVYC